jgi:hypothetical protein
MYAQGMDHSLKQIKHELKELKQNTVSISSLIHQLGEKLDKIAEQNRVNERRMSRTELEARRREERDETGEQTVIFHGVKECDLDVIAKEEAQFKWDLEQCLALLQEQNVCLSQARVETKTVFPLLRKAKMIKNEQISAKFCFARIFVFAKIFGSQEVFAKMGMFLR